MDPNVQSKRKKQARSTGVAWAIALALSGSATTLSCSPAASTAPVVTAAAKTDAVKAEGGGHGEAAHFTNDDWWPNRLDLRPLKENAPKGDPIDEKFDYAAEFKKLNLTAVKEDIAKTLTTSQDWWPADYGNYGGLMIRLAWHSAGTYRVTDGRGGAASGTIRFAPLNSWPDNVNLDKARRLLWPLKKKYGRSLSWADLMVLTGNVAFETMGFKTFGFGGGRVDVYEPTDINWGPETEWLADARFKDGKTLDQPLGATQMGLIYVNPEGPNGKADPLAAAQHIRMAFGRMSMNDEETVALIAGGHTLGKAHGAAPAKENVGREPEAASIEEQGLGWKNSHGTGKGADTISSGLEGAWTYTPVKWSHDYFDNLYNYEWELTKSPAGAQQWTPKGDTERKVPDAHDPSKSHKPMMFTTDLALKMDPIYGPISKRFKEHPEEFEAAFAKAWYKLTHRDMGPYVRLLGPEVAAPQIWQDPVPAAESKLIDAGDISGLKKKILASGLTIPQLVRTAWASASTYRDTDSRGGANGARVRLAPQKDWEVNQPTELAHVLSELEKIQKGFNAGARKVSLADLIVLGGVAAVEAAGDAAGQNITVPFTPGRTDATQELTDVSSFAPLEPKADGFRNYPGKGSDRTPSELLVDRADNLNLTAPELTVLIGGLRALNANYGESKLGVLTSHPGTLTNEFFVNLLDQNVQWQKAPGDEDVYEGRSGASKDVVWTATSVDLVFGANSQLRAIAEVYASDDAKARFAREFAAVWNKVMSLDRFDNEPQRAAALAGLSVTR